MPNKIERADEGRPKTLLTTDIHGKSAHKIFVINKIHLYFMDHEIERADKEVPKTLLTWVIVEKSELENYVRTKIMYSVDHQ